MRCKTILANALLATSAIAAPAEKRASISTGVSASVNAITAFENVAAGLLTKIQSGVQTLQSQAGSTSIAASAQTQIDGAFGALASAATALKDSVTSNLATTASTSGTASQSDINTLASALPNLNSIIAKIQTAQTSALSTESAKTSADVGVLVEGSQTLMKAFSGIAAAVQNFGTGVQTDASTSKSQLTTNTATLISQVAQLANGATSALNLGNLINSSAYVGANGVVNATSLIAIINRVVAAIESAVSQVLGGTSGVAVSVPGLTVQPHTFTIPGFTIPTTSRQSTSRLTTSKPAETQTFTLVSFTTSPRSSTTIKPSSYTTPSIILPTLITPTFTPSSPTSSFPPASTPGHKLPPLTLPFPTTLSYPSIRASETLSFSLSKSTFRPSSVTTSVPTTHISIPIISIPLSLSTTHISFPSLSTTHIPYPTSGTIRISISIPSISIPRPTTTTRSAGVSAGLSIGLHA